MRIINRSSEHAEQCAVIEWASFNMGRWPILRWLYAIPNGAALNHREGSTFNAQAQKLKAEGMKPGVSDLCLPCAMGGFHGLYIEMKYGKNTLSDLQKEFIQAMLDQGYLAGVAWSADEAIQILTNYLEGKYVR